MEERGYGGEKREVPGSSLHGLPFLSAPDMPAQGAAHLVLRQGHR